MKEYNRKTKRWEEKHEDTGASLKKKNTCRGGKPHDFQLVLPRHISYSLPNHGSNIPMESIIAFYDSEDAIRDFIRNEEEKLLQHGLKTRRFLGFSETTRWLKCSVCGKEDYIKNELKK